ncbi:hypothetical protein JTE90_002521 [Oedothorax gibbosus]|uniref:W2 domain-containing protein n=1 Tax=Oedothorax gibbosus TaxID=931172 RepID=A0AAV6TQD4_9ARAC|nr:hypothetical protein JTE90_002521 [Oedothorax gibbosus]
MIDHRGDPKVWESSPDPKGFRGKGGGRVHWGLAFVNSDVTLFRLCMWKWDPLFIRALVTAVHEYVITGANCKLARQQLKTRTSLLKHYIKHNEKYELQALYAIQVLMNQLGQPCGLLSQIFGILYDNNVISGKTFRIWEFSTDPDESEGRDAAVLSVRSFFIQLPTKEQLKLLTKRKLEVKTKNKK